MRLPFTLLLSLTLWLPVSSNSQSLPAGYAVLDIGTFPNALSSTAEAVNNRRQITGWNLAAGRYEGWLYDPIIGFQSINQQSGFSGSLQPTDINDAGQVAGLGPNGTVFRWSPQSGLELLGSDIYGKPRITPSGHVLVNGTTFFSQGTARTFGECMRLVGGASDTLAVANVNLNCPFGGSETPFYVNLQSGLGALLGPTGLVINDVNTQALAVGATDDTRTPIACQDFRCISLARLGPTDWGAVALRVNENGWVVGLEFDNTSNRLLTLWNASGSAWNLSTLVSSSDPKYWVFEQSYAANGINEAGDILLQGSRVALLTPVSEASTLATVLAGLLLLAAYVRRASPPGN